MLLPLIATLVLAAEPTVRLTPGGQDVLRVPGVTRVAVGASDVADVKVTGAGELLLLGKQKGKTTLTLWVNGRVQTRQVIVDDGRSTEVARMIHEVVSPSLKVDTYGGQTVIDGTVDSVEDLARLNALVSGEPNVKVMVSLNPRVLPVVAELITQALQREGLRTAKAVAIGQSILLEGSVADQAESQKAELIANSIYSRATNGLR